MSNRSRPKPGSWVRASSLFVLTLLAPGCNYGFQGGGGFPEHIQTIYIAPFENETAQFQLQQQLFAGLVDQLPAVLGVRPAGEDVADAVLRGEILRYDDVAQNYPTGQPGQTATTLQREVLIGISVELIDVGRNLVLWESSGLTGRGQYRPDTETDQQGRVQAVEELVQLILDGAQSQW